MIKSVATVCSEIYEEVKKLPTTCAARSCCSA